MMKSFSNWLNEISATADIEIPEPSARKSGKLLPSADKFNIIPLKLGYDTYLIFKKYCENNIKFSDCEKLLNRRGDKVDLVVVKSSNIELANLKELANYIIYNSENPNEIRVAESTLDRIHKSGF
jgi:hypothetical protein